VDEIIGRLLERDTRGVYEFAHMTGACVRGLREMPQPVVAAVNGVAAGAGAVLAAAADLRVLAESASFAFLFTKVGLSGADMGAAYLLPRLIGLGRASELLLLGDRVSAQRALDLGLANQVVADAKLTETVDGLARRLAAGPALAYSTTKMLISRELDMDLTGGIELEAVAQALMMTSRDHAEFLAAFREKREPRWVGR
jgi:enoyl-CoA hydratase/carnithine racemase